LTPLTEKIGKEKVLGGEVRYREMIPTLCLRSARTGRRTDVEDNQGEVVGQGDR